MNTNRYFEDSPSMSKVLEHVEKRQRASQFLLLAIVDKGPRSIVELRDSIRTCVNELSKTAQQGFYFDLGWLERPNTILEDFVCLNWVEKHCSIPTYQSTQIGRAELLDQWRNLESYLGMTLERIQSMC